jgi:hypothetical protein
MNHRYLRAYMAGIVAPTAFLLVVIGVFSLTRFVFRVPVPIERVIVFPMALIPNLFGAWNIVRLSLPPGRRLPIGVHGALLPFLIVPLGATLALLAGVVRLDGGGVTAFETVRLSYVPAAFVFPVVVIVYYLVWKYIVAFLNELVGID